MAFFSSFLALASSLISLSAAPALGAIPNLPVEMSSSFSSAPLTTELVWKLDPSEVNPHKQRWLVERKARLDGLRAVKLKDGAYGVAVNALVAETHGYVRPAGPWYRDLKEMACSAEPLSWFATEGGTRIASDTASELWQKEMSASKLKLAAALAHIHAEFPALAEKAALEALSNWLTELESEWRARDLPAARMAEWRSYLQASHQFGFCSRNGKKGLPPVAPAPEALMEAVAPQPLPSDWKPLARAPAKRWGGLFSVRMAVEVAGHVLDGQFLLDSGAGTSIISPAFLQAQGVFPAWIERAHARPVRVRWSGGAGVARAASVDQLKLSGYPLPVHDLALFNTDFFGPPDQLVSCCDGIIGTDILRYFAVEIDPGPPAEVRLYPREGFHGAAGAPWIEVSTSPAGEILSGGCAIVPVGHPGNAGIRGVRWDTGSEDGIDIHLPWKKAALRLGKDWNLSCGSLAIARDVPLDAPAAASDGAFAAVFPGSNIGMEVLGRGALTLDLSHGRLWFAEAALHEPIAANRTGLELQYTFKDSDRVLKVASIESHSLAARELGKAGLKPGMIIDQVDGRAADELDAWDLEQRLSGKPGTTITFTWKVRGKSKSAGLKL